MIKFYGVTRFKVFSIVDEKWLCPKETKIEFYYDVLRKVNPIRLKRILKKNIKNLYDFFVEVQNNRIIILIEFNKEIILLDLDFEICKNQEAVILNLLSVNILIYKKLSLKYEYCYVNIK